MKQNYGSRAYLRNLFDARYEDKESLWTTKFLTARGRFCYFLNIVKLDIVCLQFENEYCKKDNFEYGQQNYVREKQNKFFFVVVLVVSCEFLNEMFSKS
jgi:hypothetical protein